MSSKLRSCVSSLAPFHWLSARRVCAPANSRCSPGWRGNHWGPKTHCAADAAGTLSSYEQPWKILAVREAYCLCCEARPRVVLCPAGGCGEVGRPFHAKVCVPPSRITRGSMIAKRDEVAVKCAARDGDVRGSRPIQWPESRCVVWCLCFRRRCRGGAAAAELKNTGG